MVAFATDYEPQTATVEPKNRVGDFFWPTPDRVGIDRSGIRTLAGENGWFSYDACRNPSLAQEGEVSFTRRLIIHTLMRKGGVTSELAHDLAEHYMNGTGEPFILGAQEVDSLGIRTASGPFFGISSEQADALGNGAAVTVDHTTAATADNNGTLGNFTVRYQGEVSYDGSTLRFVGVMTVRDYYDFNKLPWSERSFAGHVRTWFGRNFIPGKPFEVRSLPVGHVVGE